MHAESKRGGETRNLLMDFGFTPEALNNNISLLGINPSAQQISPKHTIVGLSPLDPPGVAKSLAKIKATDGEACISKRLAQMVHINWRNYSAGNTGVAAAVGISSERGLSKQ